MKWGDYKVEHDFLSVRTTGGVGRKYFKGDIIKAVAYKSKDKADIEDAEIVEETIMTESRELIPKRYVTEYEGNSGAAGGSGQKRRSSNDVKGSMNKMDKALSRTDGLDVSSSRYHVIGGAGGVVIGLTVANIFGRSTVMYGAVGLFLGLLGATLYAGIKN